MCLLGKNGRVDGFPCHQLLTPLFLFSLFRAVQHVDGGKTVGVDATLITPRKASPTVLSFRKHLLTDTGGFQNKPRPLRVASKRKVVRV